MKLFVIGATGRTGWEIVQQALARGHHVTAFVRSPEKITLFTLARKAVAAFMLDAIDLKKHFHKIVGIAK